MINYLVRCDPVDDGCNHVYPADLKNCPKCGSATSLFSIPEPLNPFIYIYDIETYPNIFTCAILHPSSGIKWMFEISNRINMTENFVKFLYMLQKIGATMVGFNNINFDYSVIHYIAMFPEVQYADIYRKAMEIIKGVPQAPIWDNQRIVKQIDLFKINHYDNKAKSTSLKALEFAMRMDSIQDLPVELGTWLTSKEQDELISYNWHDDEATIWFYVRNLEQLNFRKKMNETYGKDFTNMSDSKIGSEIFIKKLNDAGIATHGRINGTKQVINTKRKQIDLIECIPDYIVFERPEFQEILTRFKNTTLYGDNVKALFKNFFTEIDDLKYVFGSGGQHACRPGYFASDDDYIIVDQDVASMYPSIAIVNNYYPEHLTQAFSPIFKELVDERTRVGKKSIMGAGLKISANGTYGNSGNKYSPFFDLRFLLRTTLTGQLTLSMLVEQIIKIPECVMIQTNTDGITYKIPRTYLPHVKLITEWWQGVTGLVLEDAYYSRMWLSDVNNYIAESMELK